MSCIIFRVVSRSTHEHKHACILYICVVQYAFPTIFIKNNQTKIWNLSLTVFDLTSSPPASIKALLLSLIISCPALLLYVSQDHYHYHKTMACSVFFKHSLLLLYSRHVSSFLIPQQLFLHHEKRCFIQFNNIKKITCNVYM